MMADFISIGVDGVILALFLGIAKIHLNLFEKMNEKIEKIQNDKSSFKADLEVIKHKVNTIEGLFNKITKTIFLDKD